MSNGSILMNKIWRIFEVTLMVFRGKSSNFGFKRSLFFTFSLVISAILFALIVSAQGHTFSECFAEKYNFKCEDPNAFLLQHGINVEENLIEQARLTIQNEVFVGGCQGGIYKGTKNTYFIKQSNVFTEFIGAKLMNLIMGTKRTPVVRLVKDQVNCVASTKLKNFVNRKKLESKRKPKVRKIKGEVDLAIAMDFLGVVDRHSKNLGYIIQSRSKMLAARVDFDASFAFEIRPRANSIYRETSNHLNLNLLILSMQTYPEHKVMQAIKRIVEIPDKKIIMTIFECWVTFSRIGQNISLDSCFALAKKLIERKNAFKSVLKDPNSVTYHSLREDPSFRKIFEDLQKQKEQYKHKKKKRRH